MRLTRTEYDEASFLDARMFGSPPPPARYPWGEVERATEGLPERCHFIFHISHVGSTLLSRLLGQHRDVFALREPAVFRTLADAHLALNHPRCPWTPAEFVRRTGVFLSLYSRTFVPDQTAVIKATSYVGELSEMFLNRIPTARAVLMFVPPRTFLRALLGGAMTDITRAVGKRLFRLNRRLECPRWKLSDLSPGEAVAMTWLCEMLALSAAAARFPDRCLWVNFDRFLQNPVSGLAEAFQHLNVDAAATEVQKICSGPLLGQYAKAPTQKYDADLRERLLQQGEALHAAEIHKGMKWLESAFSLSAVTRLLNAARIAPQVQSEFLPP
ncbi:MAG TPA: hypothetical protein VGJ05_16515 [Fimbriiglobus sp.]